MLGYIISKVEQLLLLTDYHKDVGLNAKYIWFCFLNILRLDLG